MIEKRFKRFQLMPCGHLLGTIKVNSMVSVIDLSMAYHQTANKKEDQHRWHLPYLGEAETSLHSALLAFSCSSLFQVITVKVHGNLDCCITYLDSAIVHSTIVNQHLKDLKEVMNWL